MQHYTDIGRRSRHHGPFPHTSKDIMRLWDAYRIFGGSCFLAGGRSGEALVLLLMLLMMMVMVVLDTCTLGQATAYNHRQCSDDD